MPAPAYALPTFIAACAIRGAVRVLYQAAKDAEAHFRLLTQERVLVFIAEGGLEEPTHADTLPWRNNPDKTTVILVDSYDFYSGPTHGYIAFYYHPKTNKWIIKSFKINNKPNRRLSTTATSLLDAGLIKR